MIPVTMIFKASGQVHQLPLEVPTIPRMGERVKLLDLEKPATVLMVEHDLTGEPGMIYVILD